MRPLQAAASLLLAVVLVGCSTGRGDKAGGSEAPVVLRLAASDSPEQWEVGVARYFAAQVAAASHGKLRVDVVAPAAGLKVRDPEVRVARMVRSGKFDLGWIGARAWDELDVTSLRALQAPFLVDSHTLLRKVVTGPLGRQMLAGIDTRGVVGLALVPVSLRYPIGLGHPLRTPADFSGARIRVIASRVSEATMRALGARPVEVAYADVAAEIAHGLDGEETSLGNATLGGVVTGNVILFAKAMTLFVRRASLDGLTDEQRAALRDAARRTVRHVTAMHETERALGYGYCHAGGRIVATSTGALAALRRAARPVYAQLDRDPATRRAIARIRRLKRTLPPAHDGAAPCLRFGGARVPAPAPLRGSPSDVNGTYRWTLTKADAHRTGGPGDDLPWTMTLTLRDGRWTLVHREQSKPYVDGPGKYTVGNGRIAFAWPQQGSMSLTFTYSVDGDGALHVRPVLPMNRGDRFVWSTHPWRRLGPPVDVTRRD